MYRTTLALLASPGILASMLLVANKVKAADSAAPAARVVVAQEQQVSAYPMLNVTYRHKDPLKDHLGCKCATCLQALR